MGRAATPPPSERYGPDPDGILLRVAKSFGLAMLIGAGLGATIGVVTQLGGVAEGWALVGLAFGAAAGAIVGFCAGSAAAAVALLGVAPLLRLSAQGRAGVLGAASALGAAVPIGFVLAFAGATPLPAAAVASAIGIVVAAGAVGWMIVWRSERRAARDDSE
ncbi:hypothetical protein ASE14_03295 [Agromyces sp. Root81]|uniref:hypothetical protein n=1 Tax=Agromyces sp. Root81 TaxID=1736601 RepID=UPI0006F6D2BB|nr:hypothetical protein [Agromyces sp. Root81]KRC62849.1 hypothetical protein ASE14_03295 [Agromyces sp. Root81]